MSLNSKSGVKSHFAVGHLKKIGTNRSIVHPTGVDLAGRELGRKEIDESPTQQLNPAQIAHNRQSQEDSSQSSTINPTH